MLGDVLRKSEQLIEGYGPRIFRKTDGGGLKELATKFSQCPEVAFHLGFEPFSFFAKGEDAGMVLLMDSKLFEALAEFAVGGDEVESGLGRGIECCY